MSRAELSHEDNDSDGGELEPTTRDEVTPPTGFLYLQLDGRYMTLRGRRMMIRDEDG